MKRNKYLCRCSEMYCCKICRETCLSWSERTSCCSVHRYPSYDSRTDCRPTSSGECSTLQVQTCKALSSIRCHQEHCYMYNTQQRNITEVHYRPISFKSRRWTKVGETRTVRKIMKTVHAFYCRSFVWFLWMFSAWSVKLCLKKLHSL